MMQRYSRDSEAILNKGNLHAVQYLFSITVYKLTQHKRCGKLLICYLLFYNQHLNVSVSGGCYPLKQLDLFPFKKAKTSTKMLNQKFHGSVPTLPSCVKHNFYYDIDFHINVYKIIAVINIK
jgi:hypothetical protein